MTSSSHSSLGVKSSLAMADPPGRVSRAALGRSAGIRRRAQLARPGIGASANCH
jgi:hypothetical protein